MGYAEIDEPMRPQAAPLSPTFGGVHFVNIIELLITNSLKGLKLFFPSFIPTLEGDRLVIYIHVDEEDEEQGVVDSEFKFSIDQHKLDSKKYIQDIITIL